MDLIRRETIPQPPRSAAIDGAMPTAVRNASDVRLSMHASLIRHSPVQHVNSDIVGRHRKWSDLRACKHDYNDIENPPPPVSEDTDDQAKLLLNRTDDDDDDSGERRSRRV